MKPARPLIPAAVLCLVLGTGCASSSFMAAQDVNDTDLSSPVALDLRSAPTADLSGGQLFLPHFFMGMSMGTLWGVDSTITASMVYDLNFSLDVGGMPFSLEFSLGYWDLADAPANVPDSDSHVLMIPYMVALQWYKDLPALTSRYYVSAGVGYSSNSYELGDAHEAFVLADESLTSYDLTVEDGTLAKIAVGYEFYSNATADLNLALELSYMYGQAARSIERDSVEQDIEDFPMDQLWMLRGNVSWHF